MKETFVGDTVKLVLKTGIDISGYSVFIIRYRKPDGSTGEWDAAVSSVNDTWMEYTTLESDLNQAGIWVVQAYVEGINNTHLHGKWIEFTVFDPISILSILLFGAALSSMAGSIDAVKM